MDARQMRQQLKQLQRSRLQDLGWCDDDARRKQLVEAAYRPVQADWDFEADLQWPVLTAALAASSTDNVEHQTVAMTRVNDRTFWSSRGHASPDEYDALTYALAAPACKVVAVKVAPYRALYQDGFPVYPPVRLQVWIGATPGTLQPASPWHEVQASDATQTFALWPHAPVGRYLQVRMYGLLQKQREDMQFYVAIRHVRAFGHALSPAQLLALQPLLRSNTCRLGGPTPSLSAACCDALAAAVEFGVGPEQAAEAAAAAVYDELLGPHTSCDQQQQGQQRQQQQGPETSRSRGEASIHAARQQHSIWGELVVRTGDTPKQGRHAQSVAADVAAQHDQQQQQPARQSGMQLGRWLSLSRTTAADAGTSGAGSSSGGSKRQHHHPQQQVRPCVPLWLSEEAAGLGVQQQQQQGQQSIKYGQHTHLPLLQQQQVLTGHGDTAMAEAPSPQQQQQSTAGQSRQRQQQQQEQPGGVSWFAGAAGCDGQEGSSDAGDDGTQPEQPAGYQEVVVDAARALAQAYHHHLQARLNPWEQEQVLAQIMTDDVNERAQVGPDEFWESALQLHQRQQASLGPATQCGHCPPVIALLSTNSSSSSVNGAGIAVGSSSSSGGSSSSSCREEGPYLEFGCQIKTRAVLEGRLSLRAMFQEADMTAVEDFASRPPTADELLLQLRRQAAYHTAAAAAGGSRGSSSAAAAGGSGEDDAQMSEAAAAASAAADAGVIRSRCTQAVAASQLFQWQQVQGRSWSAGSGLAGAGPSGSSRGHAGVSRVAGVAVRGGSCRSQAQQWLQPASCFCEGWEADVRACW